MVALIKKLCDAAGTNIKALEKELGFGNGTIRRWDDNKPSTDKVAKVAARFNVSVDFLFGNQTEKNNPATENGNGIDSLRAEVMGRLRKLTPEEWILVDSFVQGILASRSGK